MRPSFSPDAAFQGCLQSHPSAARFYQNCSPQQKQAILSQLHQLSTPQQVRSFAAHLPSAAL